MLRLVRFLPMKFTDGLWLLQPGVSASYAAEAYEAARDGDDLVIYAATQVIRHRAQTLQGPLLTVRLSATMPGVIKVRIEHFAGVPKCGPKIPLQPLPPAPAEVSLDDSEAALSSGSLTARIGFKNGAWDLRFESGARVLTRSGWRALGYVDWPGRGNFLHEQLSLGVGECVYGLGEHFTAFVKNGQVVENWNKDGGTSSDQAYKSVPFYITNRGYGVLVNETGPVSFEIASEKTNRVQFSLPGENLKYFIIDGPTPRDVIEKLTRLTGRPALPPAWSFGLWLTTSFVTNYDEATCTRFIDEMRARDLPLHVFHFDCFWMREFNWCDFQWDGRTFPDPPAMLRRLHDRGLHICVWINPYIAQRSPLFDEGRRGGFLLKKSDGGVWQSDLWQPGMGIVDFTNPAAREWYAGHLRRLLDMGVDCFKTDFGERIPTDVAWHDGSDPDGMHNHYASSTTKPYSRYSKRFEAKATPFCLPAPPTHPDSGFPFTGGAIAGRALNPWPRACAGASPSVSVVLDSGATTSEALKATAARPFINDGSLLAFSLPTAGCMAIPAIASHGLTTMKHANVLRFFTKLKCRLMPYLFAKAVEAHEKGMPILRAMLLEFPDDPASDTLDRQYMLGDALLVAPVMTEDGRVNYYLPKGMWTHLLTQEVATGGTWHAAKHEFLSLPLFVRPNTILPMGACDERPDYDYAEGVIFQIYQLEIGAAATGVIASIDGSGSRALSAARAEDGLTLELTGSHDGPWSVQLIGIADAKSVEGGTFRTDPKGMVILPDKGTRLLKVHF